MEALELGASRVRYNNRQKKNTLQISSIHTSLDERPVILRDISFSFDPCNMRAFSGISSHDCATPIESWRALALSVTDGRISDYRLEACTLQ